MYLRAEFELKHMPDGKMRAQDKVPKNAPLKTLRVEKSMAGDGANSEESARTKR